MAIVSTHILKVFADGGPGEGAFFKKLLPPGNLIRSKAHRYHGRQSYNIDKVRQVTGEEMNIYVSASEYWINIPARWIWR